MKKIVFILTFLFALPTFGQSIKDTNVRIRDNTDQTMMADVQAYTATLAATVRGLLGLSITYFLDTDAAVPTAWSGAAVNADDLASTLKMPRVGSFLYGYDDINDNWDRFAGLDITLSAKDMFGLLVFSANGYYNLDEGWFDDWQGGNLDGDDIAATQDAPYVGSFLHGWHVGDALWERLTLTDHADGLLYTLHGLTTASVMYGDNGATLDMIKVGPFGADGVASSDGVNTNGFNYYYSDDGSDWNMLRGIETHADGMATSVDGIVTASVLYGFNGATLDMLRLGGSKELHVTDIAIRPGEDAANDRRKTGKYYSEPTSPAKTTTATVGTAETEVLASTEILTWPNVCIWFQNDDAADPFVSADVYVSPDGTGWVDLSFTSCDSLAHGELCVYCFSNHAYRYVKATVTATDANQVSVDTWLTGNRN